MPWIGPLIGAGVSLLGSSGGDNQTVSRQEVPPQLQPLLGYVGQRGWQMGEMPFQPLPFNPTADFNPYQYAGFDMTADRALNGGQTLGMAESGLQGILGGGAMNPYMNQFSGRNPYQGMTTPQTQAGSNPLANSNPYVDRMVNRTLDDLQGRFGTNSMSGGSVGNANLTRVGMEGMADAANRLRYGDFTNQQQLMESQANRNQGMNQFNTQNYIGDLNRNANLYQQDVGNWMNDINRNAGMYQQGIGNMMSAIGQAPQTYASGFMPSQMMQQIGSTMQQQNQNQLNAGMNEFNRAQQHPYQTWNAMLQPFGQSTGGVNTTTGPSTSPAAGLLGGALAGGQLWNMFGGGGNSSANAGAAQNAMSALYPWLGK